MADSPVIEYLTESGKWEVAPKEVVAQLTEASYKAMISGATIYGLFKIGRRSIFTKIQIRDKMIQLPFKLSGF